MHRRLILLCILLFTLTLGASRTCYAQDFTIQVQVPSPTAAELGKYGDIPVSLYTGVPKIEVPVYTVETPKLSLPISLSYHASGIRVGQEASVVGLGWSLNAGGVITEDTIRSLTISQHVLGTREILHVCRRDGIALDQIKHLFLTHAHGDHSGGALHADQLFEPTHQRLDRGR